MRKQKSVVAILLAVMMIFTFMPTMAFATTETTGQYYDEKSSASDHMVDYKATWSDDFDSVTIEGVSTPFKTIRQPYLTGSYTDWDGTMIATIDMSDYDTESDIYKKYHDTSVYYLDLSFAKVKVGGKDIANIYDQSLFETNIWKDKNATDPDEPADWDWAGNLSVQFMIPNYIENYDRLPAAAKKASVSNPYFDSLWTVEMTGAEDYVSGLDENQELTFVTTLSKTSTVENLVHFKGKIADKKVKVTPSAKTTDNAHFYMDTVGGVCIDSAGTLYGMYDGNTHTIVADTVPGWTLSYEIYNPSTGNYEPATSGVSIKDVQKKDMKVKAVFKKAGMKDQKRYLNVNLTPAGLTLGFDATKSVTDPTPVYETKTESTSYVWYEESDTEHLYPYTESESVTYQKLVGHDDNFTFEIAGSEYNGMDFVAVVPDKWTVKKSSSKAGDAANERAKAHTAANKAAVEANKAEIANYLNDYYEVVGTPTLADPNTIKLVFQPKVLSSAEQTALAKKYAQLTLNTDIFDDYDDVATLKINVAPANTKDDHIAFTGTTKYVYKAKKKLAKNKSFKVNTKTDSGNAVEFTYTSQNKKVTCTSAGTIKVKKGLKKGTYKITVEARTKAGNGFKAAAKSKTYTIKVK